MLAIVVIRGIARKETDKLGNFWVDMTRCLLWVLTAALLGRFALVLVSQGVIQNLKPYTTAELTEPQTVQVTGTDGKTTTQTVTRADDRARADGLARSHQDAGHQRRRILQRQQRASV